MRESLEKGCDSKKTFQIDHIKSELRSQLSKKYKSRGGENELEKYPIEIKEYNKFYAIEQAIHSCVGLLTKGSL